MSMDGLLDKRPYYPNKNGHLLSASPGGKNQPPLMTKVDQQNNYYNDPGLPPAPVAYYR